MARSDALPDFRSKRRILFGRKTTPEQMRRAGMEFMNAGRYDDALEFFARCGAEGEVRRIAETALQRGDMPLLLRAKVVLKEETTREELLAVARKAEAGGQKAMARVAYLKAGLQEEADRLLARPADAADPTGEDEARALSVEEDRA